MTFDGIGRDRSVGFEYEGTVHGIHQRHTSFPDIEFHTSSGGLVSTFPLWKAIDIFWFPNRSQSGGFPVPATWRLEWPWGLKAPEGDNWRKFPPLISGQWLKTGPMPVLQYPESEISKVGAIGSIPKAPGEARIRGLTSGATLDYSVFSQYGSGDAIDYLPPTDPDFVNDQAVWPGGSAAGRNTKHSTVWVHNGEGGGGSTTTLRAFHPINLSSQNMLNYSYVNATLQPPELYQDMYFWLKLDDGYSHWSGGVVCGAFSRRASIDFSFFDPLNTSVFPAIGVNLGFTQNELCIYETRV